MKALQAKDQSMSLINSLLRYEVGAKVTPNGVVYTAWCPEHRNVVAAVQKQGGAQRLILLEHLERGYFQGVDSEGCAGDIYQYIIDGKETSPDFASRFQPNGVFGPSQVIDPLSYRWKTLEWQRPKWGGHVIYELHIGTFTQGGTYLAAIERLDYLKELGVTILELMPLAAWAGDRNWGYDGVLLFSPHHTYGTPNELREFVDACHARGLAVILDVVYNHLGAEGNHCSKFSPYYFHRDKQSPWGSSFNLDGPNSEPVRSFLLQNINYWLNEFRMDGFRMDATHAIHDESTNHLLAEMAGLVQEAGGFVVAEDERNKNDIVLPREDGGWGFDAVWADDFHHSFITCLINHDEIYRDSYLGTISEIADTVKGGWLYQGQAFPFTGKPRGSRFISESSDKLVYCLANHDQTGNRPGGEYFHQLMPPTHYRAASLFFLLLPYTPLLFMGQEWATSSHFFYFTDFPDPLGSKIKGYRQAEMKNLFRDANSETIDSVPDPQSMDAFNASKPSWDELAVDFHSKVLALYKSGLEIRKELFGNENPVRSSWNVEAVENRVQVTYELKKRCVRISFNMDGKAVPFASNERLILSSNDSLFVAQPADGPETRITEFI